MAGRQDPTWAVSHALTRADITWAAMSSDVGWCRMPVISAHHIGSTMSAPATLRPMTARKLSARVGPWRPVTSAVSLAVSRHNGPSYRPVLSDCLVGRCVSALLLNIFVMSELYDHFQLKYSLHWRPVLTYSSLFFPYGLFVDDRYLWSLIILPCFIMIDIHCRCSTVLIPTSDEE